MRHVLWFYLHCWKPSETSEMGSKERNPCVYGQTILDRSIKIINWGRQPFQKIVLGKLLPTCTKVRPLLTPNTKINSKWIKELNIREKL